MCCNYAGSWIAKKSNTKIIVYYWNLFSLYLPDCIISTTGNKALVSQKETILGIHVWENRA
jgi:Ran GTPase-activating protein (RanGAP) involved in mRNA processing and transport